MSDRRTDRRRADRRAFRPTVDGRLETKLLMAHFGRFGYLYPAGHIQTAQNGQAVDITTQTGESFFVQVSGGGTVKASAMPGGKFALKLLGTNNQSVVTISPIVDSILKNTAHIFNTRQTQYNGLLNIGSITVSTGMINDILGYKTTVLSGPLYAFGTNPIDRLAFDALAPGANIITGGDVNTLDIATSVNLSGPGTGINVGRDLNFFSTFGDVNIINGANIIVGRNLGLIAQAAKGTGPSSIPGNQAFLNSTNTTFGATVFEATQIEGNLAIAPGSQFRIQGAIGGQFLVSGFVAGANNISTLGLLNNSLNHGSIFWVGNDIYVPAQPSSPTLIPISFGTPSIA